MIDDKRENKTAPALGYIVATDKFMSGWGMARGGRSLFAVAVNTPDEAVTAENVINGRGDMIRPRLVQTLRADGTPRVRMSDADHLSVRDRASAKAFYTGEFA